MTPRRHAFDYRAPPPAHRHAHAVAQHHFFAMQHADPPLQHPSRPLPLLNSVGLILGFRKFSA